MNKIFTLFAVAIPVSLMAQELPYTFQAWNETYTELANPIMLEENQPWDDPQLIIDFGFDFEMMGETFDSIYFNDPGVILFPVIDESDLNLLTPYNADIISAGFGQDTSLSSISYEVVGNPGSRICKIQWKDVAFYYEYEGTGTYNNQTNFQVWFYETTNDFEFRYGHNTIKEGEIIHDYGVPILVVSKNFNLQSGVWEGLWMVVGDPANPEVIIFDDPNFEISEEQLLTGEPPAGQVYHFDTGIVGVNEHVKTSSFQLYPTIAQEFIHISFNSGEKGLMKIFDAMGNEVQSKIISNGIERTNVSHLASGPYVVSITADSEVITRKFIRQ
ncbi:MAG: T9SS type A sorting domain-containing protein [Flavobacteriales bacterium]|nr:T9SS type A sorting domain-containing protein [Flavobacteriales bacterium]